jgi:very-short-patch-repair endonuclease
MAHLNAKNIENSKITTNSSIIAALDKSRQSLLDLSLRNRLLNIPKQSHSAKMIYIYDELSSEIMRLMVDDKKTMTFLAGKENADDDANEGASLPQPDDNEVKDDRGISERHSDRYLQTMLTSSGLQKRLLSMYYDARTLEEEQGVNILYLSLGTLKWHETPSSDIARYAPLIMIPVELKRGNAKEKFTLSWRQEEIMHNLSLQAKMQADFGINIPDLPTDDVCDFTHYASQVSEAISAQPRFEICENDITLGFFSFAKFLMYRDLDAQTWPEACGIDSNGLIQGLLGDGFPAQNGMLGEDIYVETHIAPENMCHVVDADSSQTIAINEVKNGHHLIIQGPPGTGKSQTITNIIATSVNQGKKVLFVAEKMAALEVVYRRLDAIGLGGMCLELHSHKANKRQMLDELKRTMELGAPRGYDQGVSLKAVKELGDHLTKHASLMHQPILPSALSPYQITGRLVALQEQNISAHQVNLQDAIIWTTDDYSEREHIISDIAARLEEAGSVAENPWLGAMCQHLLPRDYALLQKYLEEAEIELANLIDDVAPIEQLFPKPYIVSLSSFDKIDALCNIALKLPDMDAGCLANELWVSSFEVISSLVATGNAYEALNQQIDEAFKETAKDIDFSAYYQTLATHGDSFFAFMNGKYRRAKRFVSSLLHHPLPNTHKEQLLLIETMIEWQKHRNTLVEQHEFAASIFGNDWKGVKTDWAKMDKLIEWCAALPQQYNNIAYLKAFSSIDKNVISPSSYSNYATQHEKWNQAWERIMQLLMLDVRAAFSVDSHRDIDRTILLERITLWRAQTEYLSRWIHLRDRIAQAYDAGMGQIMDVIMAQEIAPHQLTLFFKRAYYDALIEKIFTDYPALRGFDGVLHHQKVEHYRKNDLTRLEQARIEVAANHYKTMPKISTSATGALGVIKGEFAKKRNHMPIRKLLKHAAPAIQAAKPVFMMSPLSIAQFLEAGSIEFDILVMDEASQIEPVDALGAIARCKQIIVVGDNKQLPPTRFFSSMTSNDDDNDDKDEDDYHINTGDVESILSLCEAKNLPSRMLRWHYRSKHPSLIAVSNKQFYENKLFIVPSPYDEASAMGLRFRHVPNGVFDSGGTSANVIEAKAVADAVMQHAIHSPQQSLGVAAFSTKQRQAIIDELELLRRNNQEAESFFSSHVHEPFFVKNLENVQGDERDVMFISVGYARNPQGYLAMRFGPLSSEGGERRLNVLISRAKQRCEVFSSITADDIDLERGKGLGVAALKLFLQFAQTGRLDYGIETGLEADSIFEEQVAAALRAHGYDVRHQIGAAGFFIDLAIKDPAIAGRYIIGIECDGANYHSARSARDRDRLRQQVLEAHGWIIHRIWSTDWFKHPQEQIAKTIAAIESAKKQLLEEKTSSHLPIDIPSCGRERSHQTEEIPLLAPAYIEALFTVNKNHEPHELDDRIMSDIILRIITIEAPIHEEAIITRVRMLWGLGRAGTRIKSKVKSALIHAVKEKKIVKYDAFYCTHDTAITARNRSNVEMSILKKPDMIAPAEIGAAIIAVIQSSYGIDAESIPALAARLLGFQSTSPQLREMIEAQIAAMVKGGELTMQGNNIMLP